jgi:glutathione synthase/RimK-type ligase-like ATP-grasp enzyme
MNLVTAGTVFEVILIIADQDDVHSRHVKSLIETAGGGARILDFARLAEGARFSHALGSRTDTGHLVSKESVDFAQVQTIWLRRPTMVAVPDAVTDDAARTFVRHEWSAAINGMAMSHDVRWVNHPFAQNAASKPLQLHWAQKVGLPIPETLITNDPQLVREFVRRHDDRVVHKALTDLSGRLIDTRAWDKSRDDAHLDACLPIAPGIFQRHIQGRGDVRSAIIGSEVFSVFIDSRTSRSTVDSRLDLDAAYTAHELPERTACMLRELMARLGLVFGVVDLKVDADGQHVFLEVNPQGQFLFMEILTRLPISAAMANFLLSGTVSKAAG